MIFLMSSERSGSNLIRTIMARHSQVSAPPPAHLVKLLLPMLPGYGDLSDDANFSALAGAARAVLDNQLGHWNSYVDEAAIVGGVRTRSFAGLLEFLYRQEAARDGKSVSFVKDNGNILHPFELQAMFPDARFVYLVRDPRDCALSWLRSPTHTGGVAAAAGVWQREQRAALSAYALRNDALRIRLVTYEALISEPESVLPPLCEFLGIDFEAGMLEDHGGERSRQEAARLANWENLGKDIKRGNHGKFLEGLSRRQIRAIERQLAWEMAVIGYEPVYPVSRRLFRPGVAGKLYRALRSSVNLLFGGAERRRELGIRIRRLKALREVQRKNSESPRRLVAERGADGDDA